MLNIKNPSFVGLCYYLLMADKTLLMKPEPGSLPRFVRAVWDQPDVLASTNCYAFAANSPDGHPGTYGPQPGDRHFSYLREITVREVAEKAMTDGFIATEGCTKPKPGHYVVALAVAPNNDYHWYRQMEDGTWWHKPAPGKAVTNLDYDGNVITDPRTANRRNKRYEYTQFGGFFYAPNEGLKVGITPDREVLREYELQEVVELVQRQKQQRKASARKPVKADNDEFRRERARINKQRPRNRLHAFARRVWHRAEDMLAKIQGKPLPQRADPDAQLEALSERMAERARAADRHRRSAELKEIKELITFQEQRAAEGFRPTEADLKVKLSRQKGQRHSHSVAADVQNGYLRWTPVSRTAPADKPQPAAPTGEVKRKPTPDGGDIVVPVTEKNTPRP